MKGSRPLFGTPPFRIRKAARKWGRPLIAKRQFLAEIDPTVWPVPYFQRRLAPGDRMNAEEIDFLRAEVVVVDRHDPLAAGLQSHEKADVSPVVAVERNPFHRRPELPQKRRLLVERWTRDPHAV